MPQTLGGFICTFDIGIWQQNAKLLSSQAANDVA
jgi:hypothetical protein